MEWPTKMMYDAGAWDKGCLGNETTKEYRNLTLHHITNGTRTYKTYSILEMNSHNRKNKKYNLRTLCCNRTSIHRMLTNRIDSLTPEI